MLIGQSKAYLEAGFSADTGAESTAGVAFARRSILLLSTTTKSVKSVSAEWETVQSISSPYGIGLPKYRSFQNSLWPSL